MGWFSSTKDSSNQSDSWSELTEMSQWKDLLLQSEDRAIAVFKHSTRCSISRFALKTFEAEMDLTLPVTYYYLDLLEYRPISNAIAQDLDVWHESPQLIVIHKKNPVLVRSHGDISALEIASVL